MIRGHSVHCSSHMGVVQIAIAVFNVQLVWNVVTKLGCSVLQVLVMQISDKIFLNSLFSTRLFLYFSVLYEANDFVLN